MIDLSLLQDFIAESEEHLEEMEAGLLKLESDPDDKGSLNDVFRAAHSIKGSAEYIGAEKAAQLSHKLENLLEMVRQGEIILNDKIIDALMDSRDRITMLIADLENDKEEKTDIADLLKQIENLSGDNDGQEDTGQPEDENYINKSDDEILELTRVMAEPPGEDEIIELTNIADKSCKKDANEITREADANALFQNDTGLTPHPLFCDSSRAIDPETGERVIYEDDTDEELFGIFFEHLKENLFSIKGLVSRLPGSDNCSDILIKCTNAILSLKSSANYMDFVELVDVYNEWISWVEKFQEEMFLADNVGFEDFFQSVKKYIDQIADFFPSHKELCFDIDEQVPESIEVNAEESETGISVVASCESEYEEKEGGEERKGKEEEEQASLLEQENDCPVDQDDAKAADELEMSDHEFSAPVEAVDDLPGEAGSESEAFDKEPEQNASEPEEPKDDQIDLNVNLYSDIAGDKCAEDVCFFSGKLDSAFSEIEGQCERDGAEPGFFNKELESVLPDQEESDLKGTAENTFTPADDETMCTPLSEVCAVSESIDKEIKKIDQIISPEENCQAAEDDNFEKNFQTESGPVEIAAEKRDGPGVKVVKQSVRVDADKIDVLMNQAGELVVSRAGFSQLLNEMKELQQEFKEHTGIEQKEFKQFKDLAFRFGGATVSLGRVANELQEGVMKIRMLPISQLFNRYPRLVRDLVHGINKKVRLEIIGEETELDKMVIQEIADPMVHIIRNAVDHGIETVSERIQAGKPEEGVLKLTSYHESNHVVVEITDDGRGIDPDLIRTIALKKGLFSDQELERMTNKDLIGILMIPGFSTAPRVTKTSGRGVGMDVVKQNVEKLNGTIEIDSKPGHGSRLRIKIPLTLAIIKALMVRIGKDIFTVPLASVEETLQILRSDISIIEGVEVIHLRDSVLPLLRLSSLFKIDAAAQVADKEFVVVINTGMRQVGLIVDALIGQEEVVIKPLADYLQDNSGFSGATILGDGSISLILDVYELISMSIDIQSARRKNFKYSGTPANRFNQCSSSEDYERYPVY